MIATVIVFFKLRISDFVHHNVTLKVLYHLETSKCVKCADIVYMRF